MDPKSWSVADVAKYLQKIGLGQYSETFIKNDIDGATLAYLNEQRLKELGIQSIGHRIKLTRFIKSIKVNNEIQSSPDNTQKNIKDTDTIHPLHKSVHYQIFVNESEKEKKDDSFEIHMAECHICHQKIPITFYDHHEKSCRNVFLQCKREYQRRGINLTDNDIIDLINGKVPIHHIKLEKCQYCGRKFAPSTFSQHETRCKEKISLLKSNKTLTQTSPKSDPVDFRQKHQQLIEFIRSQRKEMSQAFFTETCFPIVKTEVTEAF